MGKPFVFGKAVDGANFIGREHECETLVNTRNVVTESILEQAFQDLLQENSPLFTSQTEHLTSYQLNFLRALLSGVHKDFSKSAIRDEYNLGSPTNIKRIITSLTNAELIDTTPNGVVIADPVMEIWLKGLY